MFFCFRLLKASGLSELIEVHTKGTLLHVLVKARARTQSISIEEPSAICRVSVKAAPLRGRANKEVIKLIAKRLGISTTQISLVAGITSPRKTLLIEAVTPADVRAALQR
jgi:uncharacterized protein (TIGR00251 family)